MMEIKVLDLLDIPDEISTLVGWIRREWPDPREEAAVEQRLCGRKVRGQLPVALVAMKKEVAVGFVSLVHYEKGETAGQPHWIDALFVTEPLRKQGLGSLLLRAAENRGRQMGIHRLHALTDRVSLYRRAGWSPISGTPTGAEEDVVMEKKLI